MNGEGEIAYTADIGMTEFAERVGPFKDFKPTKPELVHTWYAYPMESMMATSAKDADKYKCWKDFSGKPVYFTQAGFQNWLNWQAHLQDARLRLQARADRQQVERRRPGARARSWVRRSTPRPAARCRRTGRRPRCGMDIKVINPCPDEVAKLKAAGLGIAEVDPRTPSPRMSGPTTAAGRADPVRLQRALGYAGRARLQDDQGLLRQEGRAGEDRSGLHADGQGLRRHAGAGHQRQSARSPCIRASPSS